MAPTARAGLRNEVNAANCMRPCGRSPAYSQKDGTVSASAVGGGDALIRSHGESPCRRRQQLMRAAKRFISHCCRGGAPGRGEICMCCRR